MNSSRAKQRGARRRPNLLHYPQLRPHSLAARLNFDLTHDISEMIEKKSSLAVIRIDGGDTSRQDVGIHEDSERFKRGGEISIIV